MLTAADLAVLFFGLGSAISWGAADFSGGLASRRSAAIGVVLGAQAVGLVIAAAIALGSGEQLLSLTDVGWAIAASLSGTLALVTFYRGLGVGRMSVVTTIAAVVSASFPLVVGAIIEGAPNPLQFGGMALGILSIAVVTLSAGRTESSAQEADAGARETAARLAIGLAVIAGLGFGGYYVLIDRVAEGSVFWPVTVGRLVGLTTLLVVVAVRRRPWFPAVSTRWLVLMAGALDFAGTAFFILAAQSGRVDVAAVLSSLYPVTTIVLAAMLLRERINAVQGIGILAAIAAIVLIAAG